jgi:hypothetical protein
MILKNYYRIDSDNILKLLCKNTIIDHNTHCWNYQNVNSDGYGQITIDNDFYYVHRLAANLFFGFDINSRYLIQHKCNNKSCWCPEHIIPGTDASNQLQRSQEQFHCKWGHEFTPQNTYIQKNGQKRMCKQCNADRQNALRRRRGIEKRKRHKY